MRPIAALLEGDGWRSAAESLTGAVHGRRRVLGDVVSGEDRHCQCEAESDKKTILKYLSFGTGGLGDGWFAGWGRLSHFGAKVIF